MSKLCKHGVQKENICMECEVGPIPRKVENISDHYAYTCDCGSVHFNLLKSRKIECSGCGTIMSATWKNTSYQEMADTDAG